MNVRTINNTSASITCTVIQILIVAILGLMCIADVYAVEDVKIGVLAKRGQEKTLSRWNPLAEFLNQKLPDYHFSILPLDFAEIEQSVKQREVDFVLTNSSYYITLERKYGASRIVTMQNQVAGGDILNTFGGVVFSRRQRTDIQSFRDLKNKRFAAVNERSFGGWQMAWLEMLQQGVDPKTQFAELTFSGTHDAVVYAVLDGKADAGTVRTDTLERMQLEGKIKLDDFKIINQQYAAGFPLLLSTALYPEWPLAKVRATEQNLANKVAVSLIQQAAGTSAAMQSGIAGWSTPLDYTSVDLALRDLKAGYYAVQDNDNLLLSKEEQIWLKKHPVLTMGVDPDFAPYEFVDKQGRHVGLVAEHMQLIARKLGIKINMVPDLSWPAVIEKMKAKQLDLIAAITLTPEREQFITFTQAYLRYPSVIITRKDYQDIKGLEELSNRPVALVKDYAYTELALKAQPDLARVYVDSILQGLRKVSEGKVDALIADLATTSYQISEHNLLNLKVNALSPLQTDGMRIGVRPDYQILVSILDKALAAISQAEKTAIRKKWIAVDTPDMRVEKQLQLTEKEKNWLKQHSRIRVHNELNWPPFNFNRQGNPLGYSIDFFNEVARSLGIEVDYISGPSWNDFMEMIREGSLDVMLNIVNTEQRRQYLDFTTPYLEAAVGIYTNDEIDKIHSLNDLNKLRVAVPKGFASEELLSRHYPEIKLIVKKNLQESLEAVAFGQADAIVGEIGVINYLINQAFISNVQLTTKVKDKRFIHAMGMAVNQQQTILRDILQKAINAMTVEEVNALHQKWNLRIAESNGLHTQLSSQELNFLASINEIRMCTNPDWMPIEAIDTNGRHVGVGAEVMDLVREQLSIPIRLVISSDWADTLQLVRSGKCDIISMAMPTNDREQYLNFTELFLKMPLVIATSSDKRFIDDMYNLKGRKIGVVKNYAIDAILRENYPDIRWMEVEDIKEGLEKVNQGELYGFVGTLAVIAYNIEEYGLLDLKIAGKLDEHWLIGTAVRKDWPQLILILNKILAAIGTEKINDIYHQKIAVQVVEEFDYQVFVKYLLIILLIFLIILFRNWQIRRFAATQEVLNQKLIDANAVIAEKEALSRSILESSSEGIIGIDRDGMAIFVNPATTTILGYQAEELLGYFIHDLIHCFYQDGSPYPANECPILQAMNTRRAKRVDNEFLWRKDGSSFPVLYSSTPIIKNGEVTGSVIAFSDISQLKQIQNDLELLSVTDQLTGIYNRKRLDEVLAKEVNEATRYQHSFSVIMVDVDHFKMVNDQYGHQIGDVVLQAMVSILQERIRVTDTLGRWGGEEFMLICPKTILQGAVQLAETLRQYTEHTIFPVVGNKTACFGVASFSAGDNVETLVKRADDALYRAKENGRNRVEQQSD